VREGVVRKEQGKLNAEQRQIKETEERLHRLDQDVTHTLSDVANRIEKEKAVIAEHQRTLDGLETQRREIEGKKQQEKRTFAESLSKLLFFQKRDEQESAKATQLLTSNQTQMHSLESSLKQFTQEVKVLENKLRTMRNVKL
jgi:chromosome segregation ATPase